MASSLEPWPALIATARGALWRAPDGTIERLGAGVVGRRGAASLPLVCHRPATAARLGLDDLASRDLLELFAFVRPARFCLPTPRGLSEALDLGVPATPEEELARLAQAARALLDELEDMAALASPEVRDTALAMARGEWPWGEAVLSALGIDPTGKRLRLGAGLDVWKSLPPWEEPPPQPPSSSHPVEPRESRLRLAQLIAAGPNLAEARPTQSDYTSAATHASAPPPQTAKPHV